MTTAAGRPLRFFALLMIGWVTVRVAAHYGPSDAPLPDIAHGRPAMASSPAPLPPALWSPPPAFMPTSAQWVMRNSSPIPLPARQFLPVANAPYSSNQGTPVDLLEFIRFTTAFANRHHASDDMNASPTAIPRPRQELKPRRQQRADRWRGSAWLLWRPGDARRADIATVGRLGGSQAGLRIDHIFAPGSTRHPSAYARVTGALDKPAAPEAAIGLAVQPFPALPVSLAVERRIKLGEGARNAMAVLAAGGFGPTRIAPSVEVEAYAQAGLVGFRRRDAFIDGKFSLFSPLANTPLRIGAAISGGAQPGVERLDIGPEIQLRLPLPQIAARLSMEWRERVAGKATPASGLAVTLAADF
ncbi:hypothetical protein [Sphingobium sp.]|uniref:hypothetical protein n=1 Tax=Sphingobium sp. TaxID=1912891 RepID=UPI002C246504|nr:hypothetical protein [Sphingobium sp.]HUD92736.1 hypothetical protein [Sphingobium sp.]